MRSSLRARLFSLQTKLVLAMTALIVLSVAAAGVVFVLRNRDDSKQRVLDRAAASAPMISQSAERFYGHAAGEPPPFEVLTSSLDEAALRRDIRILVVEGQNQIVYDSGGALVGTQVTYPPPRSADVDRGFASWQAPQTGNDITLIGSSGREEVMPFGFPARAPGEPLGMLLAVDSQTLENAWLEALPGVGIAAGISTPFAVLVAVFLARQIAKPVRELTLASEALARGDFDQRVEVGREDEVGRLAKAFSVMVERIAERDAQMRSLIANVSHDLKTPMSSIIGYAQAIRDGVTEDSVRAAEVINTQANHANDLLGDLLFLSELDAGQVIGRQEDVPVTELVEHAATLLRPTAETKGVRIETNSQAGAVCHAVDRERLVRALTNVLDNAVRFSPAGETVQVQAADVGTDPYPHPVHDEASVLIEVTNTGPQIPDEALPHVFERFFRGGSSNGGHGLGLAIASESVKVSNGTVSAENVPDGVRISIRLPSARNKAPDTRSEGQAAQKPVIVGG